MGSGRDPAPASVRLATPADAEVVAVLLHDFNIEFGTPTPGAPLLTERLRHHLNGEAMAALLAGDPAAAVALVTFRPGLWDPGPVALLEELYVRPALRGRGIGTALLDAALAVAAARGAGEMQINVDEGDAGARRFYERHGFRSTEEGSDELLVMYWRRVQPGQWFT